MKTTLRFRTLILSDIHLGAPECKIDEVNYVLKRSRCETLILNGDIIDGWSLLRAGGWKKAHTRFVRLVLKMMEKRNTRVVYLRGNHDDVLGKVLPLRLDRLRVVEDHIHEGVAGRYLVLHGDVFDAVNRNHRYLALLGDIGYQSLLKINRLYNRYRTWRGKEYYSLSKAIKSKVKRAVSYVGNYEEQVRTLAVRRGCRGVICGHIHTAADKMIGDVHYLNSGDWVESMTALVEHLDGRFEIVPYEEFRRRVRAEAAIRRGLVEKDALLDPEISDHPVTVPA
jgi:UDP-2,3-diacylglucosamine pyrophosphatase LpxH